MNSKIWAILIVSILVVAGASVLILSGDKDKDEQRKYPGGVAGCLQVYGNANNDYTVDSEDRELISKLISDGTADWKEDYPFADANNDGKLDESDLGHVDRLINASTANRAVAHAVCYSVDYVDGYVEEVKVPVTKGSFNFAATTIMALGALGIVDEMCGATRSPTTWYAVSDPLFYDKYLRFTEEERTLGPLARVDVTLAANFVKSDDPLTCYVLSSANAYDRQGIRDSLKNLGVSTIQIDDGAINPLKYASGILLLGYLFGTENNDFAKKSHAIADRMADLDNQIKSHLKEIEAKSIPKKTCVVSTMANYVSGTRSSNSHVDYYGMTYALDEAAGTVSSSLKYNPGKGDNWLNKYDIDIPIALTGESSDDWRWYTKKDPHKAPEGLIRAMETYKTLENYDDTIVICATMPAPFRVIFVMEMVYPELFDRDSVAIDTLEEFYFKFFGWSEDCLDGIVLAYRPSELKAG